MRTLFFMLIFMLLSFLELEGQPLRELSTLKEGDSLLVEVKSSIWGEGRQDNWKLDYPDNSEEIFSYRLILGKKDSNSYQFSGLLTRYRNRIDKQITDKHFDYDSEFDSYDYSYYFEKEDSFLQQTFSLIIYPEKHSHSISFEDEAVWTSESFVKSKHNPKGISSHINAIFFVKKQPLEKGVIEARLIPFKKLRKVNIIGRIKNPFSAKIYCSSDTSFYLRSPDDFAHEVEVKTNGDFEFELEMREGELVYFFHKKPDAIKDSGQDKFCFPLYLEPGDSIVLTFDTQKGDELFFEGKDAKRFTSFQNFYSKFLGPHTDYSVSILPFPRRYDPEIYGFSLEDKVKRDFLFKNHKHLQAQGFKEILSYLENEKDFLGKKLYLRLKAETIYNYLSFKLLKGPGSTLRTTKNFDHNSLTLSYDKEYYLDSLGLSLESVKASDAYPEFLSNHLHAKLTDLESHKKNTVNPSLQAYHFASYEYRGFALQTLLKEILLRRFENIMSPYRDNNNSEKIAEEIRQEIKIILEDFYTICKHKPYLDEVTYAVQRLENLKKSKPAPDIAIGQGKNLSDYFGDKIVLVQFQWLKPKQIEMLKSLKEDHPSFKIIFIHIYSGHIERNSSYKSLKRSLGFTEEIPGELYYNLGFGSNKNQGYFFGGNPTVQYHLIDQNGLLWGSQASKLGREEFVEEAKALAAYNPNPILKFYEERKSQLLNIFLWISAVFNLYLIYFLFYLRPKRKHERLRTQRIETELRAIRSQMNPHFLFNSLSSVQNLINQSDKEKANHYLSRFSQLVRKVLNHSEQALIPLEEELKVVDLYCELEALRFKFEYHIEVDPMLDVQLTEVPSMLIQPYVENAVRHGIAMQAGQGFIGVYIRKVEDHIEIEILDNGMGIHKHRTEMANHVEKSGFGLRLSEERIQKINERYGMDISYEIQDRRDDDEPGHGTRVLINIPTEQ